MTWWQTLIVAGVSGVIAPFFLWLQQRGQNQRAKEDGDRAARQHEADAERDAAAQRLASQRDAYEAVLRAVHRYRAERSIWGTKAVVCCETTTDSIYLGQLLGMSLSGSQTLVELQEAIGAARLWATTRELHAALLDLLGATDRAERTFTDPDALATQGRDDWQTFQSALAALANATVAALAHARGEEPPPYEQVMMGREPLQP